MAKPLSRWTEAERLAWGRQENAARKEDLRNLTIDAAQVAARCRRNTIGATANEAVEMIRLAQVKEVTDGTSTPRD
jgi:hypothetical protein